MEIKFYTVTKKIISTIALLLLIFTTAGFANKLSSVALYYAPNPPVNILRAFDAVVVDPDHKFNPASLNATGSQAFAYVSIGEVSPKRSYYDKVNERWIIGANPTWHAEILDQSNSAWQKFFVDHIITPLWNKGYKGFFFDTMDSYNLAAKTPKAKEAQINGLIKIIKAVKKKYPQAKIILNRGFEVLPKVHKDIYAVAAESLFSSWNESAKKYEPVAQTEHIWLLDQLNKAHKKYDLPVISIDYVSPQNNLKAKNIAKQIENLGFIPYVTNGDLTAIGTSSINILPRKILMLYNGAETSEIMDTNILNFAAMPLEYYGYVPIFHDVNKFSLKTSLNGQYAGILIWISNSFLENHTAFQNWLIKQKNNKTPIVILGALGDKLSQNFKKTFGLTIEKDSTKPVSIKIIKQSPMIGYEVQPFPTPYNFYPLQTDNSNSLLELQSKADKKMEAAALTSWGGYVLNPAVTMQLPNGQTRWVVNPLTFFTAAFQLKPQPIPDVTTENGRRLMMVHLDGDGFVNRAEWHPSWLSGEAMLKEIFERYKIPTSVSIIQGEINKTGLYPKFSKEAMRIAREIFKLPWVEIASHSYSHPFIWKLSKINSQLTTKSKKWYLPIKNYKFNLKDEITNSVNFINTQLAPPNKNCKMFFWTGDCDPSASAVALTYKAGLLNINGGDTTITNSKKSLTNIAPLGVYKGKYFQVFAANQNENIYTNLWRGPFYGYRRVIETFKLTNSPYRFKPIDIYYHFYSASKTASLKALKEVYNWALAQPIMNIYTSEYIKKVLDFNNTTLVKQNNCWTILTNGNLREFRAPQALGYPDLKNSKNVIGFSLYGKDNYIHLGPDRKSTLCFAQKTPKQPYIITANGRIDYFNKARKGIEFKIKSYVPAAFDIANVDKCKAYANKKSIGIKRSNKKRSYLLKKKTEGDVDVFCS